MNQTANYGWKKPGYQDAADIETVGGVFEQIDTKVKEQDNQFSAHQTAIEGLQTAVEGVHTHANKGVLDGITAAKVAEWDAGGTPTTVTVTLTAAGWAGSGPYTQTVSVTGITASDDFTYSIVYSGTSAEQDSQAIDYSMLSGATSGAGTVTFVSRFAKPTVNLSLEVRW